MHLIGRIAVCWSVAPLVRRRLAEDPMRSQSTPLRNDVLQAPIAACAFLSVTVMLGTVCYTSGTDGHRLQFLLQELMHQRALRRALASINTTHFSLPFYLAMSSCLLIYIYVHLSLCLSMHLSYCPCTCLSICTPAYPFCTCMSSRIAVFLLNLSLSLSLSLYIYIYICISYI
jgi:hypothetical protein